MKVDYSLTGGSCLWHDTINGKNLCMVWNRVENDDWWVIFYRSNDGTKVFSCEVRKHDTKGYQIENITPEFAEQLYDIEKIRIESLCTPENLLKATKEGSGTWHNTGSGRNLCMVRWDIVEDVDWWVIFYRSDDGTKVFSCDVRGHSKKGYQIENLPSDFVAQFPDLEKMHTEVDPNWLLRAFGDIVNNSEQTL